MPELLPFAGLRPNTTNAGRLDDVVCPPYDVISEQERLRLADRSPYNVVRVELPNGQYEEAARLLREWRASGVLAREEAPALYGYRMSYKSAGGGPRQTVGVIGALVLEPPGRGILPHERTTPKAKSDRLELVRATEANTSPIWCLCSQPGLTVAVGLPSSAHGPAGVAAAHDDDGVLHEIWPLLDGEVHERVAEVVGAGPLLVADGHHRYETALAYQAERLALQASGSGAGGSGTGGSGTGGSGTGGSRAGGYGSIMSLVVELSEEQLEVRPIHRLVSGLPAGFDVLQALAGTFELEPTSAHGEALPAEMASAGALGAVTAGGCWLARPRPGHSGDASAHSGDASAHSGVTPGGTDGAPGGLDGLDSSRADEALSKWPAHGLAYEASLPVVLEAVSSGRADAALLCRPATVAQIASTAHGGERMPPKTTFFWPKPRTGMVLRDFAG